MPEDRVILVTGFEPFGAHTVNPSEGLAKAVDGRRVGDFGIRKALPVAEAAKVSVKNGWLYYYDDRNWHINCMAVTESWAMSVLQRYPGHGKWNSDYAYGQNVCREVAKQLINPDYPSGG